MIKTVLNTLKEQQKNYVIYQINIKGTVYIGSTNNYSRRMNEHLNDLKNKTHVNTKLQSSYTKHKQFESKIEKEGKTLFSEKTLREEQRYINRLSNSNISVASNNTMYDFKELLMDILDLLMEKM